MKETKKQHSESQEATRLDADSIPVTGQDGTQQQGYSQPATPNADAVGTGGDQASTSAHTLRMILGGDILSAEVIRKQVWLMLLITLFVVLYISNRYSCQKKQVEIHRLTKSLNELRYKTLSTSSMLTEKSRESHVMDLLRANNDSTIHTADQPPYIIIVDEKE